MVSPEDTTYEMRQAADQLACLWACDVCHVHLHQLVDCTPNGGGMHAGQGTYVRFAAGPLQATHRVLLPLERL